MRKAFGYSLIGTGAAALFGYITWAIGSWEVTLGIFLGSGLLTTLISVGVLLSDE